MASLPPINDQSSATTARSESPVTRGAIDKVIGLYEMHCHGGCSNGFFTNDASHSQKDNGQNPHDDEELLIYKQQTVEIRLPFRANESLSMMDEDSAEERESC